ncbi:MAG: tRNA preQ1(34) S-adenosylmethionine ribosyltransferase-isomerase QueA [Rhodobacteraceae bacterium]|nr:tRNA preQ1(34) S-adenosylmethionine ribosyltransferase-isomerase QueA [Paracoccaceae bacterium]
MKLSALDFSLPRHLIATRPAVPRSAARLLVATPARLVDTGFAQLETWLQAGDRLVFNNTKVLAARLSGQRLRHTAQGTALARIAVNLLGPHSASGQPPDYGNSEWRALVRPLKKWRLGEILTFAPGFWAELCAKDNGQAILRFNLAGADLISTLGRIGSMPLPPYIAARRPADAQDRMDYQSVFARHAGAVAAPTASLHFDTPLLQRLAQKGIGFSFLTLHVGAGTFLPLVSADIRAHKMHAEWGQIPPETAHDINATRAAGGRIIAIGTTSLRLLETAAREGILYPWQAETDLFITPGFRFQITDALLTNFHLPRSTLLLLVSAFVGHQRMRDIYAHAVAHNYRFFSYGDASLLLP